MFELFILVWNDQEGFMERLYDAQSKARFLSSVQSQKVSPGGREQSVSQANETMSSFRIFGRAWCCFNTQKSKQKRTKFIHAARRIYMSQSGNSPTKSVPCTSPSHHIIMSLVCLFYDRERCCVVSLLHFACVRALNTLQLLQK